MRRRVSRVLGVLLATAIVPPSASALTATTKGGSETFKGAVVTSGRSGTRAVLRSAIVARGAFDAVGRIVEIQNLPTDPGSVSRDDLVFAAGTLHVVTKNSGLSISMNPRTCAFTARARQTTTIEGGSGRFKAATGRFTGTVDAFGLAARAADGTCTLQRDPLAEFDALRSRGSLSLQDSRPGL
jgi:hypothetical protein